MCIPNDIEIKEVQKFKSLLSFKLSNIWRIIIVYNNMIWWKEPFLNANVFNLDYIGTTSTIISLYII